MDNKIKVLFSQPYILKKNNNLKSNDKSSIYSVFYVQWFLGVKPILLLIFHLKSPKTPFTLATGEEQQRPTPGGQMSCPQSTGPLLQQRFESTSEEPEVRCCRVYSQISRAALTCTLSERMTPCWGISTHTSNIWSRLAGIPSRSLL